MEAVVPDIPYDASCDSLFSPQLRPTVFTEGVQYDVVALSVEFSRLAYIGFEKNESERSRLQDALASVQFGGFVPFVNSATGTAGFGTLRQSDGLTILAFRGTDPRSLLNLGTDINAVFTEWGASGGRVHQGFAGAARSISDPVTQWVESIQADCNQLILTGHSLGAAIATLFATLLGPARLITIGSPRVGDSAFVTSLGSMDVMRYVDCCDIVTELPPEILGYKHAGPTLYLTSAGHYAPTADEAFIGADRLAARAEYLCEYAGKIGDVGARDLADHAPINYVRAVFP
jgi:hypothetical protein